MSKLIFPPDFIWGAATASYQIEGAVREDGRGESIWDHFSHTPGRTYNGETGDSACDHYHRYPQDAALMQELGLKGYRFSIAWPRLFPDGTGRCNLKGVEFYQKLLDQLLQKGIEPLVTLYHWDLPQKLQERGGWDNRDTASYFADYAALAFEAFGDRVPKWITFNEPSIAALNGHALGEHAPGYRDYALAIRVSHHLNLAHANAVQVYRQTNFKGMIGTTLNFTTVYPASPAAENQAAARLVDGHNNRWYSDPVLKGVYPQDMLAFYTEKLQAPMIKAGDLERLAQAKIDFLGVNYYFPTWVKAAPGKGLLEYEAIQPAGAHTAMGWEVNPQGLYDLLVGLDREYDHPLIYVTENGAAFNDRLIAGQVADPERLAYLKTHFAAAHRAIQDGVNLRGYYVWSLMDNFEWAHGTSKRFGLFYIDYATQARIWKESARWYQSVIAENGI